jgi:TonB family protein
MSALWQVPGRILALERWVPPQHRAFSVALVLGMVAHLLILVGVRVDRPVSSSIQRHYPQVRMVLPEGHSVFLQDSVWSDPSVFALPRMKTLPGGYRTGSEGVAWKLGHSIETMLSRELSTEAEGKPMPILAGDWLAMRPSVHGGGGTAEARAAVLGGVKGVLWVEGSLRERRVLSQPEIPERRTSSSLAPVVVWVVVVPGGQVSRAVVEQSSGDVEADRAVRQLVREICFAPKVGTAMEFGTVVVYFPQLPPEVTVVPTANEEEAP